MANESLKISAKDLKTSTLEAQDLIIQIGKLPTEEWTEEPMGPTPMPDSKSLRDWDFFLNKRYKPMYAPLCDMCCLCTFGKCDLSQGKKGACGIDLSAQSSRIVLLATLIGCSCHTAHGRHLVHHLIEKYGPNAPLDVGDEIAVEMPNTRLICGYKPKTLKDLEMALEWCETTVLHGVAAAHTGQEGAANDFESKAFHVSMADHVGMEVADVAQLTQWGFPKGDEDTPLVESGLATIDVTKPVLLVVGHNVAPGIEVIDYLRETNQRDKMEVCGICCSIHDLTRYDDKAKIVGPISWQLRMVRSGVPDVIQIDEQCIRTDIIEEAKKIKAKVIVTNDKACHGLPNWTDKDEDWIINQLFNDEADAALIWDAEKAGRVSAKLTFKMFDKRKKFKILPTEEEVKEAVKNCTLCYDCQRACPENLEITDAIKDVKEKGDFTKLAQVYNDCVGCGRCEQACSKLNETHSWIVTAGSEKIRNEVFNCRVGRGPIKDTEIRNVGAPIVLGEIPGIVAIVGCSNYPRGTEDVAKIAEEFLKRRYIVVTSGCGAMDIGRYKVEDDDGNMVTLYEKYPGTFDAGGLVNTGSCVANAHITGAAVKVANIFARRPLRGNFEEIADYILNRVGAVGIAWGAYSQKAASIGTGCNRFGVPVIVGPHGVKYRRQLLGRADKKELWEVYDANTGETIDGGPCPEHLLYAADTVEECIVMTAKLAIRSSDNFKGRQVKLTHYIDLHKKYFGTFPDDVYRFVREEADIPVTLKEEVMKHLKEKDWKPTKICTNTTTLKRLIRTKK
ncbi:MAG: CO dehydrogenase/acetyl-CoA synthase complex subunit epsilon [Candidatus Lokiarchaeota archaeon]|nr:CO dehydrogenase/acetyl-CoA synthase complex subunit epsilon [Candidatus Lokiarchaeota archaeon]